jgi:cysteine synthase A
LLRVERLAGNCGGELFVKLESMEPGSVKDRAVANMVAQAVRRGDIGPDTEVVEASSGNLAFALSAILGVMCERKPTIFMSKMHGPPKRRAVRISGSRIVLTNAEEGTRSAKRAAVEYSESRDDVFQINQHGNPDNPGAHRLTTGPEIYHQTYAMTGRPPDEIVCSVGSGGTAIGLSMFRDAIGADFRVIGVEPENASLLTGGDFHAHHFSGMAPGWITDLLAEHRDKLDEIVTASEAEAFATCRALLVKEGLLVGPSSGAAIGVALHRARLPENKGKLIVAFAHDRGDRYLDIDDLFVPPADATELEVDQLT